MTDDDQRTWCATSASHLPRALGTEPSHDTISTITDGVLEEVRADLADPSVGGA